MIINFKSVTFNPYLMTKPAFAAKDLKVVGEDPTMLWADWEVKAKCDGFSGGNLREDDKYKSQITFFNLSDQDALKVKKRLEKIPGIDSVEILDPDSKA